MVYRACGEIEGRVLCSRLAGLRRQVGGQVEHACPFALSRRRPPRPPRPFAAGAHLSLWVWSRNGKRWRALRVRISSRVRSKACTPVDSSPVACVCVFVCVLTLRAFERGIIESLTAVPARARGCVLPASHCNDTGSIGTAPATSAPSMTYVRTRPGNLSRASVVSLRFCSWRQIICAGVWSAAQRGEGLSCVQFC